jgi:hypothetical protein
MPGFFDWTRVDTGGRPQIINEEAWDRSRRLASIDETDPTRLKYFHRLQRLSATEFETKVKKLGYKFFKNNEYYAVGERTRGTLVETIVDDVLSGLKYDYWGQTYRDETGRVLTPAWFNLSDFVRAIVNSDLDNQKAAVEDDRTRRAERVERAERNAREMEAAVGISVRPVGTRSAEARRAAELAEMARTRTYAPFRTKKAQVGSAFSIKNK